MASAVSGSEAEKILIPSSHCGVQIAGTQDCRLEEYLESAVTLVRRTLDA